MFNKYLLMAIAFLVVALFGAGTAYLHQRDENVRLKHTADIAKLTQEYLDKQQEALAAITEKYSGEIAAAEQIHEDRLNDIMAELAVAQREALQKPVTFGDRFIADIIRIDCLRSLGQRIGPDERKACSNEAANADPAKSIIPFTAITPTFLTGWSDACAARGDIGTGTGDLAYVEDDWVAEFGNFDKALCGETLVAMTPEGSLLLRNFLETSLDYEQRLVVHALEQSDIIDQLSN